MIDTKELRLRNYVLWGEDTGFDEVVEISYNDVRVMDRWGGTAKVDKDDIIPIPLTPEILEKCGFEKRNYYAEGVGRYSIYWKSNIDLRFRMEHYYYGNTLYEFPVKYVHQLQNLYFALTGEELKINW